MFNLQHILYMVIYFSLTAVLLVIFALRVKKEETKNLILKISAISTVIIHYSVVWYDYFTTGGTAPIKGNQILPIYPCNVVMWLLLICSCIKDKSKTIFRIIADFCFYGGIVCGVIGIVLNANFDSTPTLADFEVLKGMLSHSTMLFGCIYLFVGGYIKVGVFNVVGVTCGLGSFVVIGKVVNSLYEAFNMEAPDGMFLEANPYFGVSPILLGVIAVILMFGILALYELRLPKEERWYSKLKTKIQNIKESR